MRLFAIGDIHGCATALAEILAIITPRPADRIVCLGDYINKGPDSKTVLDLLIPLTDQGIVLPLKGNHELRLLAAGQLGQARTATEVLVDQQTLASYQRVPAMDADACLACIPPAHWQFVQKQCLHWLETKSHIFVHANLEADQPLSHQPDRALFWDKLIDPKPHKSGKIMVCGHTPQRNGQPLNLGHAICLDTAACEGQWLTCLEVGSGQFWQTNQQREFRHGQI